ncbi:uncharacterized protein N7484_000146 [Penicillium longicatenatum]|uniref:uncharacterized protein n=1 Tax=Penicillium longicatenatum TaxID=1561947 RepID=UPI00254692DF|nr:uncharacterized protein N7484_000146 [Penicillium longicatenatum]KAJ5660774.1 hypothetical protein N7484_000146 [Penicillium longicatenatum]
MYRRGTFDRELGGLILQEIDWDRFDIRVECFVVKMMAFWFNEEQASRHENFTVLLGSLGVVNL